VCGPNTKPLISCRSAGGIVIGGKWPADRFVRRLWSAVIRKYSDGPQIVNLWLKFRIRIGYADLNFNINLETFNSQLHIGIKWMINIASSIFNIGNWSW